MGGKGRGGVRCKVYVNEKHKTRHIHICIYPYARTTVEAVVDEAAVAVAAEATAPINAMGM